MKNKTILPNIYLAVVLILLFIPIAVVVIYSFNASRISSVWEGFSFEWYRILFRDTEIFKALVNSIILGVASSLIAAVIGTLGAIGSEKSKSKLNGAVTFVSMLPIMIPEIILGMVFMSYFVLLKIPFGMWTLIIAHTAFCIPYIFMMVRARLVGMDDSIKEAARDLGANERQVFFDITLPLIMPAIVSGMILSFAMSFDDVIISIFVTGVGVNTLPIKIYSQLKTGVTPEINALCTLLLVATMIAVALSIFTERKNKK